MVQVSGSGSGRIPVGGHAERTVPLRRQPVHRIRQGRRFAGRPHRFAARSRSTERCGWEHPLGHGAVADPASERFEPVAMGVAARVWGREAIASDAARSPVCRHRTRSCGGDATSQGMEIYVDGSAAGTSGGRAGDRGVCGFHGHGLVRMRRSPAPLSVCKRRLAGYLGPRTMPKACRRTAGRRSWKTCEGNIWVRSEHQLAMRSPATRRFQLRTATGQDALPPATNTLPTLALDPEGKLLVPTNLGLARQTESGWEIVGAEQGLTTNDISAVQQDREGSIWIGLLGSGLARWLGYREWQSWNEHDGLSRESVWALARDSSGRLWVGTQFGLDFFDEQPEKQSGRLVWQASG